MNILRALNPYQYREMLENQRETYAEPLRAGLRTSIMAVGSIGGRILAGPIGETIGTAVGFAAQRITIGRPTEFLDNLAESVWIASTGLSVLAVSGLSIEPRSFLYTAAMGAGAFIGFMHAAFRENQQSYADPLSEEEILRSPNAFVVERNRISIHPLILQHRPEEVLSKLVLRDPRQPFQVRFLNDNLTRGAGFDAGGLRKQFMSELFRNLLDGSDQRTIQMHNGIPTLSSYESGDERRQLFDLGMMLRNCLENDELTTGRVFPDSYFTFLSHRLLSKKTLTDEEIIEASLCLMDSDQKSLLNIYKNPEPLSEADFEKLQVLGIFDLPDQYESIDNQEVKNQICRALAEAYRFKILAAKQVRGGMSFVFDRFEREPPSPFQIDRISTCIQGSAFSRTEIASRISYRGASPILQQKVDWLRKHILDESTSQEWIEKFLFTVTGQRIVTASTSIHITPSSDNMCKAHTCFNQLDLPLTHTDAGTREIERDTATDRQKFLNGLQVLMDFAGTDFQMA